MKLALRFLFLTLAGLLLVYAAFAVYTVRLELQQFDRDTWDDHSRLARAIVPAFTRAWRHDGSAEALRVLSEVTSAEERLLVVWLPQGRSGAVPAPSTPTTKGLVHLRIAGTGPDAPYSVTYAPVHLPNIDGTIAIRESTAPRRAFLRHSLWTVGLNVAIVFAWTAGITVIFGVLLVGRPVGRLVQQARRVATGELSARSGLSTRDEIGELAREMDRMTDQLEKRQRQLNRETAERLRALHQLRHADRLATVGRLAAGVAHELGTPLNIVLGRAKMIRKDKTLPDTARRNAAIISDQVERMVTIVRQTLGFARAEEAEPALVDIGEPIRRSLRLLGPMAQKHGVALELKAPGRAVQVMANASQISQVMANLVVNAIQATRDGGAVTVGWQEEQTTETEGAPLYPYVAIRIEDHGCGMAPSVLARVFEPFFTTKDVGEGTGLGLSVVYGIVKEHGGFLRVESTEGRGSTFTLYLPLAPESLAAERLDATRGSSVAPPPSAQPKVDGQGSSSPRE